MQIHIATKGKYTNATTQERLTALMNYRMDNRITQNREDVLRILNLTGDLDKAITSGDEIAEEVALVKLENSVNPILRQLLSMSRSVPKMCQVMGWERITQQRRVKVYRVIASVRRRCVYSLNIKRAVELA